MEIDDAIALIRDAVGTDSGVWADLGAGAGTFTRALAQTLGAGSTIYAVDADATAVAALHAWAKTSAMRVIPVRADFTRPLDLPGLGDGPLDGVLLANALHFVRDAESALTRLVQRLRVGGRIVVVEYDRRAPSRWVPYPIDVSYWPRLAAAAGLAGAAVTATIPSAYSGVLYAGAARRM
ncbi:MAG TPA: methyltransferase domain-containing protein [Gemmatimonadaceae bacterium]|nr:methyltransferase domain-containing protein [Gemmatimonadaceae bacterium]